MRNQVCSVLLSSFLAACGGTVAVHAPDGGPTSVDAGPPGTCAGDPACPVDSLSISIAVLDAKTGTPIATTPYFSVTGYLIDAGINTEAECGTEPNAGACPSWYLNLNGDWRFASPALLNASQEIIVSAPGYVAQTFSFTPTQLPSTGSCECLSFSTAPASVTVKLAADGDSNQ